jgi:MOSC domain-containing protein YiiM
VQVSQPRAPCFKLDVRLGEEGFLARFASSGRIGFYLRVLDEGEVGAGDAIARLARDPGGMSVLEVYRLRYGERPGHERLEYALGLAALSPSWREAFRKRLAG